MRLLLSSWNVMETIQRSNVYRRSSSQLLGRRCPRRRRNASSTVSTQNRRTTNSHMRQGYADLARCQGVLLLRVKTIFLQEGCCFSEIDVGCLHETSSAGTHIHRIDCFVLRLYILAIHSLLLSRFPFENVCAFLSIRSLYP